MNKKDTIKWVISLVFGALLSYLVFRVVGASYEGETEKNFTDNFLVLAVTTAFYCIALLIILNQKWVKPHREEMQKLKQMQIIGGCLGGGIFLVSVLLTWLSTACVSIETIQRTVDDTFEETGGVVGYSTEIISHTEMNGLIIVQTVLLVLLVRLLLDSFTGKEEKEKE